MSDDASTRPGRLILVPATITLAVTLLRLVGELQGWSPRFFSREAGGGGALVGIAWLVPVFGAWFGWKLAKAGQGPEAVGRALGLTLLGLALLPVSGFLAAKLSVDQRSLAILGNWGTHYDVPPPGAPEMSGLWKWAVIGLLPQLTIWLWFTSVVGAIFGIAAGAIASRRAA